MDLQVTIYSSNFLCNALQCQGIDIIFNICLNKILISQKNKLNNLKKIKKWFLIRG